MAHEERYGTRCRAYSAWHRRKSLCRYIGIEAAQTAHMIDLDASLYVEYDEDTKAPLALIETAVDVGQQFKPATVTRNLAERADIPAGILLYTRANDVNPADTRWPDITEFRFRRIFPEPKNQAWETMSPAAWAEKLMRIRRWSAKRLDRRPESQALADEPVRRVMREICAMQDHDRARLFGALKADLGWTILEVV